MKKILFIALMFFVWGSSAHAHGKKHVHGEGRLDAAFDKGTLTLSLEFPLDVAVGFERKPKNDKEKAALEAAENSLRNAEALWIFSPSSGCKLVSAKVGSPKFEGKHADIEANYAYQCTHVADLMSVETTLFKSFTRLSKLEVQHVKASRQGATRLTAKSPVLRW